MQITWFTAASISVWLASLWYEFSSSTVGTPGDEDQPLPHTQRPSRCHMTCHSTCHLPTCQFSGNEISGFRDMSQGLSGCHLHLHARPLNVLGLRCGPMGVLWRGKSKTGWGSRWGGSELMGHDQRSGKLGSASGLVAFSSNSDPSLSQTNPSPCLRRPIHKLSAPAGRYPLE